MKLAIVRVVHEWTDEKGRCGDCGDPAAYCAPDRYGEGKPLTEHHLLCGPCAALCAATEGERIVYLFPEDDDSVSDREVADQYPMTGGAPPPPAPSDVRGIRCTTTPTYVHVVEVFGRDEVYLFADLDDAIAFEEAINAGHNGYDGTVWYRCSRREEIVCDHETTVKLIESEREE